MSRNMFLGPFIPKDVEYPTKKFERTAPQPKIEPKEAISVKDLTSQRLNIKA